MTSIHKIEDEPDFRFGFSRENTVVLGEGKLGWAVRESIGRRWGAVRGAQWQRGQV